MAKFGRNYILNIQTRSGTTLTVRPPFSVEFDITRNVLTSANVSQIRVYNLNENHRSQLRKNINDYYDNRIIQLLGGYGDNLSLMFEGNITQAWSVREGVDFITQIESFDGGFAFANSQSSQSFPAQTEQTTVVSSLINDLAASGVKPGAIGSSVTGQLSRGNAYTGNTCALLQQLTGGRFYIDNSKAFVLADNECISGPVTVINAKSGLLNTPVREQTIINFDMLFEPRLIVGQQITLESLTADSNVNGNYKIISLKHRGIISETVAGTAVTSVGLLQPLGDKGLTAVDGNFAISGGAVA